MIARLRNFWASLNGNYWFYPAVLSIAAALLAFATIYLDRHGASDWLARFEFLSAARPVGARNLLSVIAGSMIGIASTVFAITIAAVVYASGNYGPRLLTNFMQDRGNQLSLGVFIATFVYTALVLRVVRDEDEEAMTVEAALATSAPGFVPQLSLLIATAMAGVAIGVLVYFLNHIPNSIRINSVLHGIGERLIHDVKARFPDAHDGEEPVDMIEGAPVIARDTGYIQMIHFGGLATIARDLGARLALVVRTGDFVHPDRTLAVLEDGILDDEARARIADCFLLGGRRTPTQNLEFLIDELVEIALRALSPGINDPFTAITAMHWLGAATAELARRDLRRGPEQDDYDRARVRPLADDFAHFLAQGFGGIRASAAANALASKRFLGSLSSVAATAPPGRRREVADEGDRLLAQARHALAGPALDELEQRHARFVRALEAMEDAG